MAGNKWLASLILSCGLAVASPPAIKLANGTVYGTTCGVGVETSVYRGIPYAEPPLGKLRFMPPQPLNTSYPNGALNATEFGPTCVQVPGEFAWSQPSQSEDCLTLTVYVPLGTGSTAGLPVKVWAHGGGDTAGSASYPLYDLCNMATDSIGVAVQYRLGPLGYLALDTAGIEGNMGVKDKLLALEWVQANIASFGGDPRKVLLFGQSSGGDDTFAIASLPQAKSLLTAAVCQSGGGEDIPPYETMQIVGRDFATSVNCSNSDLACLQAVSADVLNAELNFLPVEAEGQGEFGNLALTGWSCCDWPNTTDMANAHVDGKLIAQPPLSVGPQVPIILGSTTNDGSLFAIPPLLETGTSAPSEYNYTHYISQFGPMASTVAQQYPLSLFNSSGSTEVAVIEALTHIQTVSGYTCQIYRGLRSAAKSGVPAYAYSFGRTLSCPWLYLDGNAFPVGNETEYVAQPMHTAELPLLFSNLYNQPWGNGTCNMTETDHTLSANMKAAWTAMAATGNPSTSNLIWTEFDECSSQGLYIGNMTVIQQLDFSECVFWDQIQAYFGGVNFTGPSNSTCSANGTSTSNGSVPTTSAVPSSGAGASGPALGSLGIAILVAAIFQL